MLLDNLRRFFSVGKNQESDCPKGCVEECKDQVNCPMHQVFDVKQELSDVDPLDIHPDRKNRYGGLDFPMGV